MQPERGYLNLFIINNMKRNRRRKIVLLAAILLLLTAKGDILVNAEGGAPMPAKTPDFKLAVTYVQPRQQTKPQSLAVISQLIDETVAGCVGEDGRPPDMMVFSETIYTRGAIGQGGNHFEETGGPLMQLMRAKAQQYNCWMVYNFYEQRMSDGKRYNTNKMINRRGELAASYDKTFVTKDDIALGCTAGLKDASNVRPVMTEFGAIGMLICYDVDSSQGLYPQELVHLLAERGAQMVIVSSIGDYATELRAGGIREGVWTAHCGQDAIDPAQHPGREGADALFKSNITNPLGGCMAGVVKRPVPQPAPKTWCSAVINLGVDYRSRFNALQQMAWKEIFKDTGQGDWSQQWFLDGDLAKVVNSPEGMTVHAGPAIRNEADHAVLWTKEVFEAENMKIEYKFTRIDTTTLPGTVNIIYILAQGGAGKPLDILEWAGERREPHMAKYYNMMETYHVSYSVIGPPDADKYLRGRRYMPDKRKGLNGTELTPEYMNVPLFEPGVTYQMTFIKAGRELFLHVEGNGKDMIFYFDASNFPPVEKGRVGLRQMWTRISRYSDFKISVETKLN